MTWAEELSHKVECCSCCVAARVYIMGETEREGNGMKGTWEMDGSVSLNQEQGTGVYI